MNNLSTNIFGINGLRKYGVNEMNLLLLISFKFRSTKKPVVSLTFEELNNYAKIKNFSQLDSSYFQKFTQTTWTKEKNNLIYCHLLFNKFEINLEQEIVSFFINLEIADNVINISEDFSLYDLEFFLTLKSSYVKVAYILTKKMEGLKKYTISIHDFKLLLSIPSKYKMSDIDKKIFSPILEYLDLYYPGLKIEKINKKNKNHIDTLKFNLSEEIA